MSWRVRFLPDLGEGEYFQEIGAVDGEPLLSAAAADTTGPFCYWCYNRQPHSTYFAIRGGGGAWPTEEEPSPKVWDYDCNVVLLIEAPSEVYGEWYEPRDLSFEDAVELLTSFPDASEASHWAPETLFSYSAPVCNVAFLDGSVRSIRLPLSERNARLVLKAHQAPNKDRQILSAAEQSTIKRDKVAAWVAFVTLTIGPAFMPRSRKQSRPRQANAIAAGGRGRSEAEPPVNR